MEPLTEAYDSSGSGPHTDLSTERRQVTPMTVPSQHRLLSANNGKESAESSGGNTPRFRVEFKHLHSISYLGIRSAIFKSEDSDLTLFVAIIFSEGRTTYISKMHRGTKKRRLKIRCQQQTDLRTVKQL